MPRPPKSASKSQDSTANLGFEAKLWLTADKLRNNRDAAELCGANRVERDSLHEVQPASAGAEAHGKQTAAGSPKGRRGGAIDYDVTAAATKRFFATMQNKLHWAIHGQTADP